MKDFWNSFKRDTKDFFFKRDYNMVSILAVTTVCGAMNALNISIWLGLLLYFVAYLTADLITWLFTRKDKE